MYFMLEKRGKSRYYDEQIYKMYIKKKGNAIVQASSNARIYDVTIKRILLDNQYNELVDYIQNYIGKIINNDKETIEEKIIKKATVGDLNDIQELNNDLLKLKK